MQLTLIAEYGKHAVYFTDKEKIANSEPKGICHDETVS
jgi:hypothetical protein